MPAAADTCKYRDSYKQQRTFLLLVKLRDILGSRYREYSCDRDAIRASVCLVFQFNQLMIKQRPAASATTIASAPTPNPTTKTSNKNSNITWIWWYCTELLSKTPAFDQSKRSYKEEYTQNYGCREFAAFILNILMEERKCY